MPSDIYIKTSSGGWSSAAKAIQIKVSSTLWKAAKAVFLNFDVSGWTKVWPVSGPFATNFPFIVSTASGSTHLTAANVRRVGTSLYGRFNPTDWNSNGWGTLFYTYTWKYYTVSASGDATGETQISTGAYVAPSRVLVLGTGQDQKYLSFKIRGTSASNPIYFGESESGDSEDGRIYIAKNQPELLVTGYPEIQVGSKGTSLTAIPNVGDVLTYSNTWDTASDKSITSSRTVTRWYRKTTFPSLVSDARSAGGGYLDTTGLSSIGTGLTYTVTHLDIGNYIYCNQEVFNSGTDYDFAGWKYDQATQVPPQEGYGKKVGEACYNKVLGAVPVGTAGTVTYTRDPASYTYTVSNSGTWTNTPTSYRYQWYLESQTTGSSYTYSPITGATSSTYNASVYQPSGTTSYKIVPVVWATNSNGESTFGFGLINSSDQNITSTAGGIAGTPLRVFYREPSITTFTVTGGVNKFTYVSDYLVYDPANTAVISWTGTGTGSLNVTSSAATQTSAFLAAGTYSFTLTVTNTGSSGGSYSKTLTRSAITITAPAAYSFTFGTGNPLYVGTNGHIHFDSGYTSNAPATGKALAIYLRDLIQGQPTADTIGLKYWSDASNYVIQFKGYGYNSPASYTSAYALDYQVKFNTANAYADVSIIRKGGSVPQPQYVPGMYIDSQKWISSVDGIPTYTVPTDLTDEGDTANAYTYRLNFNGTQGSLNITPWAGRAAGKQYRIPDSLMISAQAINSTNNTAGTTAGSLDDGWTKLTPLANQYNLSTITAGTATATSTSLSIPFTTGGADYSTYSYVLRSGSHSGTVVASATGQTANPIIIPSGLSASTTYYLTLTPVNSMGQSGTPNLTTHVTSARNKAAGTKKIIPLGITVTSGSTIAYVSTNGYIGLNSDPSSSVSIPTTGRYLNLLAGDLRQTALYTTATSTTYSIRYQGAWYNDPSQTVDYEIKFTFGSTAAEAYIITNNLTTSPSDSVLFVNNVSSNTWSTLNNSTMTATAVTRTGELQDGVDDARTQIPLTATSLNLTTTPAYGSATSAPTGWSASITTAASPSGGTYSLVSATAGTASVNSSNGALTVSGLTASQSSTVTTRYSLSGYNSVDITKAGSASAAVAAPTNSSPPTLSVSPSLNVGGTFTFTAGTWTGSPTSYALYLYRGTASVATSETVASGPLNAQSGTYIIPLSDFNDANNRKYYRAFASATNAGGTSSSGALTPGQELGPITNTVTLKRPNIPTGLTTPSSGTSPNLIFNTSSWTAPAVDATHNAATHYQVYFEASTADAGTYVAAANTFTYTNNQFGSTVATNANTPLTAKAVYATSVSSGRITASTGSYTWVKMWVRAANADGFSDWVSKTG